VLAARRRNLVDPVEGELFQSLADLGLRIVEELLSTFFVADVEPTLGNLGLRQKKLHQADKLGL
jgi:hypothetical protein